MVPTVVHADEYRSCPRAGLTRRASLELPDRGPSMLCGRCTPRICFASCTWVRCEVSVCVAS